MNLNKNNSFKLSGFDCSVNHWYKAFDWFITSNFSFEIVTEINLWVERQMRFGNELRWFALISKFPSFWPRCETVKTKYMQSITMDKLDTCAIVPLRTLSELLNEKKHEQVSSSGLCFLFTKLISGLKCSKLISLLTLLSAQTFRY